MNEHETRHARSRLTGRRRPRRRPRRQRSSPAWRLVEFFVALAIGVGALFVVAALLRDRMAEQPSSSSDEAELESVNPPLDEWKQQGRPGWERIFDEACTGLPGYIVDVGRPARLKLAELGAQVRPMLLEKVSSSDYTERIVAIQILGAIGEPPQEVCRLLERELRQAAVRRHEVAVLKCAATLPSCEPVVIHLSLVALDSQHAGTRRIAAEYLYLLRSSPAARGPEGPARDLTGRLLALLNDPDPSIRLLYADRFCQQAAPRSYQVLLDGLNSTNSDTMLLAAYHVAALRGVPHVVPGADLRASPDAPHSEVNADQEVRKAIEAHRKWLQEKLH